MLIVKAHRGPGSRGGHVVGYTRRGAPVYYHASHSSLRVGKKLKARRTKKYHLGRPTERVMEHFRPTAMPSRLTSLFMTTTASQTYQAGGEGAYVYKVTPKTRVTAHDGRWLNVVFSLVNGYDGRDPLKDKQLYNKLQEAAHGYWSGAAFKKPTWHTYDVTYAPKEFLVTSFAITAPHNKDAREAHMTKSFVIDIAKAGKKGTQWAAHKRSYLFRITLPNGRYLYIPDATRGEKLSDYGHFEDGKFVFKEGLSAAAALNQRLLGGPTGKANPETGKPEVKNGLLRRYEVVHKKIYKNIQLGVGRASEQEAGTAGLKNVYYNPYLHNADGSAKDILERTTIGDWLVFCYPNTPVLSRNAKGDPVRYAGIAAIEPHQSLVGHGDFDMSRLPRKIQEHVVGKHDKVPQPDIKPGGEDLKLTQTEHEEMGRLTATPVVGDTHLKILAPKQRPLAEIEQLSGLKIDDDTDPIVLARALLERNLYGKKAKKPEAGQKRVGEFPSWVRDKFRSEQEMLDHLQNKPTTFLVTIGVMKPTPHTRKINKRLMEEWAPIIYRMCRNDAAAVKFTKLYDTWRAHDQSQGIDSTHPESKVRNYVLQVTSDLASEASELFLKLAYKYEWSTNANDRFDKLTYVLLHNHVKTLSTRWANEHGSQVPIVHETDIEEAANQQRQAIPLSPDEQAELQRVTPIAREALARVFNSNTMPETYTRIISAHLFLDDLVFEQQKISERSAGRDAVALEHELAGKELPRFKRDIGTWRRNWTGKDSIAQRYRYWTDPRTGAQVDMHALDTSTQFRKLTTWYDEAISRVQRELSVPIARREATPGVHGRIAVPAQLDEYTPEEKLVYTALGQSKHITRVLTNEGRALKRYLEIESKLASSAARAVRATTAMEEDRTIGPRAIKLPGGKTQPLKHVVVIPPHEVPAQPHKPRYSGNEAVGFFSASKNQQLAQQLGLRLHTQDSAGVYAQPNVRLGSAVQRGIDLAQQHYARLQTYRKMSDEALAHEHEVLTATAKRLDALVTPITKLHNTATAYAEQVKKHRVLAKKRAERRAELDPGILSREELAQQLKQYTPKESDKNRLASLKSRYDAALAAVQAVAPAIAERYAGADRGDVSSIGEALSSLTNAKTTLAHKLALVAFDKQRRETLNMKKALVDANTLVDAIYGYSFALGTLFAELS